MSMLDNLAGRVARLHDTALESAGGPPVAALDATHASDGVSPLWYWIHTNHFFNSSLWAEEDLARRTTVRAEEIAQNKRAIDKFNQARNDATERVDEILLTELGLVDPASAQNHAPVSKLPRSEEHTSQL